MQKDIYGYKVTNTIKVNRTARACVFLLEKDNRISRSGAIRKLLLRFIISTVERVLIRKIHLDVTFMDYFYQTVYLETERRLKNGIQ